MKGRKSQLCVLLAVCAAVLVASAGTSSVALAIELHAFDAELSLTGGCGTSPVDPVRDPGPCPGAAGVDHPAAAFSNPRGVATDFYGNIYVASSGEESALGTKGRIDVFDSSGHFITEIKDESGPGSLAVDSEGNLYVANGFWEAREEALVRYSPTVYEPEAGNIKYGDPAVVLVKKEATASGLAINRLNNHLLRKFPNRIIEYSSKTEGNNVVDTFGESELKEEETGLAVDAAHGRVYASAWERLPESHLVIRVFELAAPHNLLFTIEESDVPGGAYLSFNLALAVDEGTGNLFIYDADGSKVYELHDEKPISTISYDFRPTFHATIAVDNGVHSPNGAENPIGRYLFVPSHPTGVGHSFAFGPPHEGLPTVEALSAVDIGEEEAQLRASVEPFGLETHYIFEYITQQQFDEQEGNFAGALVAREGDIPAGNVPVDIAAPVKGLQPDTAYRFRVIATNAKGTDEGESGFSTYPAFESFPVCPNDALRTGLSALLPDCRAYELVTPPDTNARTPRGVAHLGVFFATREASPQGGALSFQIEGGILPGSEGAGSVGGYPYRSARGGSGWTTADAGPSSIEAPNLKPGSTSPDQGYSLWTTSGISGSAVVEGKETFYVRYPDGHSELVGRGSLGTDPQGIGKLISDDGKHIIFSIQNKTSQHTGPAIQLEPNAPPQIEEKGTGAIYDRTSDEVTHVISLLPEDVTPEPGEDASYAGASLDGRGVAFRIDSTLYLRYDNQETYEIGKDVTVAGVAEGGNRIFYLEGGDIYRFDALTEATTRFTETGDVTPVNVAADGTAAYFVSPTAIEGLENPHEAEPVAGEENLYLSREGTISFVGTVTKHDVEGEIANVRFGGLGLWDSAVSEGAPGIDPSRTTPDGHVLLFESRAPLDGYDPEGHVEVYRYDSTADELACLSCTPTASPASSDASLQSISQQLGDLAPLGPNGYVSNLAPGGGRAFFQSSEPLVLSDTDGSQDVYEWEDQGVGSCNSPGGCAYLISSGQSLRTNYLYAASDSGDDVFFVSSDLLLPRDAEETPSVYDARVGGGFPEPVGEECEGEGCRPGLTPTPAMPSLASRGGGPSGNPSPAGRRCPEGKRKVRRGGKARCVKKHRKHRDRKAGAKGKGAPR